MISEYQAATLKALGKIEEAKSDVRILMDTLSALTLWRPAAGLLRQGREVISKLDGLQAGFDRKLAVAIIGPCGSGKSTLINAISGVDGLSESGIRRPTTQKVVAFCQHSAEAQPIVDALGADRVSVAVHPNADRLEHVMLIDTPDVDSTESDSHLDPVHRVVGLADVLICVFNAENPKTRDHVDFFSHYARIFGGEAIAVVLNKCDRLDEGELKKKIVPEFSDYLSRAWAVKLDGVYCVSARRNLQAPHWESGVMPRHEFDQFSELHRLIYGTFNRAGFVIDRRVRNAEHMKNYVGLEVIREVENDREVLGAALDLIRDANQEGETEAKKALDDRIREGGDFIHTDLCRRVSEKWMGPVGWILAMWTRLLLIITGVSGMFKERSAQKGKPSVAADIDPAAGVSARFRNTLYQHWPDIAELLVRGRFNPTVRQMGTSLFEGSEMVPEISRSWQNAVENAMNRSARRLSSGILQLIFNLPALAVIGHVGWTTVATYFSGKYLPTNFFVHAFVMVGLALLGGFFLLQLLVGYVSGSGRILAAAKRAVGGNLKNLDPFDGLDAIHQVKDVLTLTGSHLTEDAGGYGSGKESFREDS